MYMDPSLPLVAVMPSRQWAAADDLNSTVLPLELLRWDEAWLHQWDSDAHFVCYLIGDASDTGPRNPLAPQEMPRCKKRVLPHVRAAGLDLVTQVLALDFDLPGHVAWTDETLEKWLDLVSTVSDDWPMAWQWSVLYTTAHGARIVYVLDRPVPVDEAEPLHRWLVMQWTKRGVPMDFGCSDWTRLFRLPKVLRDGEETWKTRHFQIMTQPQARLKVSDLQPAGKLKRDKGLVKELRIPKPEPEIASELLTEQSDKGATINSAWLRLAKRRLRNRASYPCLFGHEALADEGSRHNTILKFTGEATTLLFALENKGRERITTPQHIYALFLDPVLQLEPDNDTPDWTDVLWLHVLYCWANEDAEDKQRQEQEKEKAKDILCQLGSVVHGMREWCDSPELLGNDDDAKGWALQHLIACSPRGLFLMRRDGWYDSLSTNHNTLIPRIRSLGMGDLIQIQVPTEKGVRWASAQDLINEYGTAVNELSGKPQTKGGYISAIDTGNSNLRLRLYGRRTDIAAKFDPRVDEWLRLLFGENYDAGLNWIGWSLAFEEGPTAALSLQGAAGAGKKMLAYGLAECVDTQSLAQAEDLVSDFQPGLLRSPFLLVDEGWPNRRGGKHPADMFRELVGGSTRHVNQKFKSTVETTNPVRVLFTANDLNVVRMLTRDRDLSPEDREALGIRLLHFDISHHASFWLRERGGAAKFTRGWIAGDGGAPSEHIVARHFLWLYENKRGPRGARLLVEGNSASALMQEMRTQSGSAPIVIESIIRMLEIKSKKWGGLVVEHNRLYVLSSQILEFWRQELQHSTRSKLNAQTVGQVMRGLVNSPTSPIVVKARHGAGRKRWHEVDCNVLLDCAVRDGWDCKVLEELVLAQKRSGIIYKDNKPCKRRKLTPEPVEALSD